MQLSGRLLFGSARNRSILLSWQRPDFDAIKPGYTVGLGPERDLACAGKCAVGRGEQLLAVKRDREPLTFRPQTELVHPATALNRTVTSTPLADTGR